VRDQLSLLLDPALRNRLDGDRNALTAANAWSDAAFKAIAGAARTTERGVMDSPP
jgi:hypothetical protein